MACITDYTTGGSIIIIVVVVLVAVGGISVSPERMEREGRSRLLNEFSRRRRRRRNLCSANWTPTSSPFQSGEGAANAETLRGAKPNEAEFWLP